MEKEQNPNTEKKNNNKVESPKVEKQETNQKEEKNELSSEERIIELEDKLARTFAEMENQRRRFE